MLLILILCTKQEKKNSFYQDGKLEEGGVLTKDKLTHRRSQRNFGLSASSRRISHSLKAG